MMPIMKMKRKRSGRSLPMVKSGGIVDEEQNSRVG